MHQDFWKQKNILFAFEAQTHEYLFKKIAV
jgi:hypothetical protein